ncbi:MAG: Crp/Fnr family transcriptional regulator [Nitrospirota bacterium]|nr:Crp/Fnr family transcriptional regulator [Nitrospirota bacterium]
MQKKDEAIKRFLGGFLGSQDKELLAVLEHASSIKNVPKRTILFVEGQPGSDIYFMLEGSVRLFRTRQDGSEFVVHFVRENEVFAELLPFLGGRYPVSAQALEPSELLTIHANTFEVLLAKDPKLCLKIIAALTARIQGFLRTMENLATPEVKHRLLAYLKGLSERRASNRIRLPAPKHDIALLLGTTPETLSRLFKKLEEEGMVKVKGREIELTER